jgi:hypothetical protein
MIMRRVPTFLRLCRPIPSNPSAPDLGVARGPVVVAAGWKHLKILISFNVLIESMNRSNGRLMRAVGQSDIISIRVNSFNATTE